MARGARRGSCRDVRMTAEPMPHFPLRSRRPLMHQTACHQSDPRSGRRIGRLQADLGAKQRSVVGMSREPRQGWPRRGQAVGPTLTSTPHGATATLALPPTLARSSTTAPHHRDSFCVQRARYWSVSQFSSMVCVKRIWRPTRRHGRRPVRTAS
jgi:hypothetical protein